MDQGVGPFTFPPISAPILSPFPSLLVLEVQLTKVSVSHLTQNLFPSPLHQRADVGLQSLGEGRELLPTDLLPCDFFCTGFREEGEQKEQVVTVAHRELGQASSCGS